MRAPDAIVRIAGQVLGLPQMVGGLWFAPEITLATAAVGAGSTSHAPRAPAPSAPGGATATGGASSGLLLFGAIGALLFTFGRAIPRLTRRLDDASALWRPVLFSSLIERPG
jgi:hypothetical protein